MGGDKMWLLAIDTSTEMAGVALYDGESVYELSWKAGRSQTVVLLEQIHYFLCLNSIELGDVGAVAVASGPGTFNGLRVGLSTAKGLSYGNGIPIIGVDTLEATAYPHSASGQPIRAFVPAGRGRVVSADYRKRNARWIRVGDMQNRAFEELVDGLTEPTLLVGECPRQADLEVLETKFVEFPRPALRLRRPGMIAEIAYRRWSKGDTDEIAALEPVYVHGSRNNRG